MNIKIAENIVNEATQKAVELCKQRPIDRQALLEALSWVNNDDVIDALYDADQKAIQDEEDYIFEEVDDGNYPIDDDDY